MNHVYEEYPHRQHSPDVVEFHRDLIGRIPFGSIVIEIGTWTGGLTAFVAVESVNQKKGLLIYTVDPFDTDFYSQQFVKKFSGRMYGADGDKLHEETQQRFDDHGLSDIIMLRCPSVGAADLFDTGTVEYVFVDGCHQEESVRQDILAWWPKLRIGGTMVGHDMQLASVSAAVKDVFNGGQDDPPFKDGWIARKTKEGNAP